MQRVPRVKPEAGVNAVPWELAVLHFEKTSVSLLAFLWKLIRDVRNHRCLTSLFSESTLVLLFNIQPALGNLL